MTQISSVPRMGDMNADVGVVQQALIDKGIKFKGGKDDVFGSGTLAGIIEFQKRNNLHPAKPGNLGPKTLFLLGITVVAVVPSTGKQTITKDLQGKADRHMHPSIRVQYEAYLFPNGKIPQCFIDKDIAKCRIEADLALAKIGIIERGRNNMGDQVGQVQGTTGRFTEGGNGDAWCLDYEQLPIAIIEDFFGVESPVPATAHCLTCWNGAKKIPGLTTAECEPGTLALGQYKPKTNGHAMGVIKALPGGKMQTNEGNTSIKSLNDGDASGLKERDQKKNGGLITLGFVRTYPYNQLPAQTA